MGLINYSNRVIEYSFYLIFFFVPLFFLGSTSELFEFNKMWVVFGFTILIGVCWISKMIVERQILIRRTPLDILLVLFLLSQIISTIFSLDSHVSLWGYYSRFNGGLFSTISYIFLYYAFVSNLEVKHVMRTLFISLISGLIAALWGFPSHYGYDPTCFLFRGSLDTKCWTEAFQPTVRVFSTLGQPAWFAAYLNILLPLSMAYTLIQAKQNKITSLISYLVLTLLFYACLIFANTRAGTDAFYAVTIFFWVLLFIKRIFPFKTLLTYFLFMLFAFVLCNLRFGTPVSSLDRINQILQSKLVAHAQVSALPPPPAKNTIKDINITDSWDIRMIVWKGAIDAWRANPVFGTGVETFAFAYYRYRPAEHNLTSEWDYLYNKAHNEYLNFLTTTGIFGLGTYLLFVFFFIFVALKYIFTHKNPSHDKASLSAGTQQLLFVIAMLCSFISILITNFSGFSVVIINLYLFLIPAFIFLITGKLDGDRNYAFSFGRHAKGHHIRINSYQWVFIIIVYIIGGNMILGLFRFWYADTVYAMGSNLDRGASYQQALPLLEEAVSIVPDEPVYIDELSINLATLSEAHYLQNLATPAGELAREAVRLNNHVVESHPNNIIYWKNRLRIFYSLANGDPNNRNSYLAEALRAVKKSSELAPTDAKIFFNYGVLLGQMGNLQESVKILEKTIALKPNYYDAYYALGLLYHQLAINQTDSSLASSSATEVVVYPEWQKKAIGTYQYIMEYITPENEPVEKLLEEWKKQT